MMNKATEYADTKLPGNKRLAGIVRSLCRNTAALPLISCAFPGIVYGNPVGEQIIAGDITITRPSNISTVITQDSAQSIINWQQFSIAQQETVNFIQPDNTSVSLNRVTGGDPSTIFGQLVANGQVYLVNTHGVYFGPNAQVDVSALIASGLDINNSDFLDRTNHFQSDQGGQVINNGNLKAADGGYIVLIGEAIDNNGVIQANNGEIALGAGSDITLNTDSSGLVSLVINKEALTRAGINNSGDIISSGGRIYITAALADSLAATAVNNTGLIQATGVQEIGGEIYLVGDGGAVSNNGVINANADAEKAGKISLKSTHNIILDSISQITASGATHNANGGEVQIVADGTLNVKNGSVTSVDGGLTGGNGGQLELSGKDKIALNGQFSGRAYAADFNHGSLIIDPLNINIKTGGTSLTNSSITASSSPSSTLDIDPDMSGGAWTNVTLNALSDITVVDAITNTDIPINGSLSLTAGQDIHVQNNIGSSASAFSHDLNLTANRNIVIGDPGNTAVGIIVGGNSNQLSLVADANNDNIGDIDITGNRQTTIQSTGDVNITGHQMTLTGGNSSIANTAKLITSTGNINITLTGDMTLTGGSVSNGSSTIDAFTSIRSNNNIDITLTTGDLTLQGGIINQTSVSNASTDVSASIRADNNIVITSNGIVNIRGGDTSVNVSAATNSSASIFAFAEAGIYADKDNNSAGDIVLSANSLNMLAAHDGTITNSAQAIVNGGDNITAVSNAVIDANNVTINSVSDISLSAAAANIFNNGSSSSATQADAAASALINADNDTSLNITGPGNLYISAGEASITAVSTRPADLFATADAGINSGRNVSIDITNGDLNIQSKSAVASVTGSSLGSGFFNAVANARSAVKSNITTIGAGLTVSKVNNINLYGGTSGLAHIRTNDTSSADAIVDTSATISGYNIELNVKNDLLIKGGSGSANAQDINTTNIGGSGSADATLHTDARIIAGNDITVTITDGNITLTGGIAQAGVSGSASGHRVAHTTANAEIISTNSSQGNITTNVSGTTITNGTISVSGGQAGASGHWIAASTDNAIFSTTVNANAGIINNSGSIDITADNLLSLSGGQILQSLIASGSSINGSASIDASARIGTASGNVSVTVTNGSIALNGNDKIFSSQTNGALISQDNHVSIGGDNVNLIAGNDITIDTPMYDADLLAGGALSVKAGRDVIIKGSIGSSGERYAHDITIMAENNINVGGPDDLSLYLANNTLSLFADSNGLNSGDNFGTLAIVADGSQFSNGNVLINTQGLIDLKANKMNVFGGQASNGSAQIYTSNNINTNIGSGGISIKGGNVFASSGDSLNVSAGLHADGNIAINITNGSLTLRGGNAVASVDSLASSSAVAITNAEITALGNIDITANQGAVNVYAGSASASIQGMSSIGLIADAAADASISTSATGTLTINTNQLNVTGGIATALAFDGSSIGASSIIALATANSSITSNNINLTTGSDITIRGGEATANAAASSSGTGIGSASAFASITANNNLNIDQLNTGNISITGGTAIAAAMFSDASFSGTGNAYADAPADITAKQSIAITNTNSISVLGGSAQAVGMWGHTSASGASFASIAKANAGIKTTTGNITIAAKTGLAVRGGNAITSPQLAGSSSGGNTGSASANANAAVTAAGNANISVTNGGTTWVGGGSNQLNVTGGITNRASKAVISGLQLNLATESLYINSDGNISLPTSAVFVIGNGVQSEAIGDKYLMNALAKNLLAAPETLDPNLMIVSSGELVVDADMTFTGSNPYAWFMANSTSIDTLNFTNATNATIQYTPYTASLSTAVDNLSALSSSSASVNYFNDTHFSYMNDLPSANIIIGSGSYDGSITVGTTGLMNLQNMNIGLLSTNKNGISGLSRITTNGSIFTLWSSTIFTDTFVPVRDEFQLFEDMNLLTDEEKKSRNPKRGKPLFTISTR